ncbi:unnamed protein product [Mytilus edulis]|uniref:Uncharacterized protein n=1 Tax=Mytilus edulis TaxID=6550 RepID=A0A8S3Q8A0_MYTED|nr:unnamed protein product [Mytilus edulis]
MYSEEEKDSIWLFDVLEGIGVNDEYRRTWQQTSITNEILQSVNSLIVSNNYGKSPEATVTQSQNDGCEETSHKEYIICKFPDIFENIRTLYIMGSTFEATFTPDESHDIDGMECHEWLSVIENISKAEKNKFSLLIVREPETPAGYVKLQLVGYDKPLTSTDWPFVKDMFQNLSHCFKIDKLKRLVICDFFRVEESKHMVSRLENKPAFYTKNYYGHDYDSVISYRGKRWPSMAK